MNPAYVDQYGKSVTLLNKKPINYSGGGMIKWPNRTYGLAQTDMINDNLFVLLEKGSLVVPRPVAGLVRDFFGLDNLKQPPIKNTQALVPVIVMPDEIIVPKSKAKMVDAWLRSRGFILPIPRNDLFRVKNISPI
jgi:hypothetical protein